MLRNTIIEPGLKPVNDNNGPSYNDHVAETLFYVTHGYESVNVHKGRKNLGDFLPSVSNDN